MKGFYKLSYVDYQYEPDLTIKENMKWLVLKSQSRCEKKLAEFCIKGNINHYLPLRKSVKRYKTRVAKYHIPMFSGYIFVQLTPEDKNILYNTGKVVKMMIPDDHHEEKLILELKDVRILEEAAGLGTIVVRPEIETGSYVVVNSGCLAGLHGIVTRRKNKARISVNVDLIGQSVSLEIDVAEVELDI